MSVGEVCNREVVVAGPRDGIPELVRLLREFHVGDVVVVEERDGQRIPVGIVTDRDVVIEVTAEGVTAAQITAGDIMSPELLLAREEDDVVDAVKRMRDHGVRRLPVVNGDGALVGILTVDDLVDLFAELLGDLAKLISIEQRREKKARA